MTVGTSPGTFDTRPTIPGSLLDTTDKDPREFYADVRRAGGVVWDEEAGSWLVAPYDLLKRLALADTRDVNNYLLWSDSYPPYGTTREEWLWIFGSGSDKHVAVTRGAEHEHQHRWWFRMLSPKVLALWNERLIEPIANARLDAIAPLGRAELSADFCEPVGGQIVGALLGIPWRDAQWFSEMRRLRGETLEVLSYPPGEHPSRELIERAVAAAKTVSEEFRRVITEKRREGEGDDFISVLCREADSIFRDGYTDVDIAAAAISFLTGATGTGAASAANGLHLVMTRPGLQDRALEGGKRTLANLAEETLRLHSASEYRLRRAECDIALETATIKAGDMITFLTAAANRDPHHYPAPEEVDLDRKAPRDHLALLMGPRICAGQSLARYQLERVLTVALTRLSSLRLDPDAPESPKYAGASFRVWKPLHAVFDAEASH